MPTTELKDIVNKFNSVIEERNTFDNKINTVKGSLLSVLNKFNSSKQILKTIVNFINTIIAAINNITNDVRTKALNLHTIDNDIRFIKSWQRPGSFGFQSLGKSYIHVYINGVDQTDIDVDSVTITKNLNSPHTATFDLIRTFDATKPSKEQLVLIKYNDWTLYRGYVVSVSPISDPEKLTIECSDEYWYQNRTNKYFHVGHIPSDNREKYYNTIATALSTEFSWSVDIGNFVPQTIDCFAQGISECISSLVQICGNYGFYYDVQGSKTLWSSGAGDIVEIEVQEIGKNLGLYQIIKHSINTDVSDIVNKFRVQMGDKVVKNLSNRSYQTYQYAFVNAFCTPTWDMAYEQLASVSGDGSGFDWHNLEYNDIYKDIFRVWKLPILSSDIESWSDRFQPEVRVYNNYMNFFNIYTSNQPIEKLTTGFTIDYENGLLIFNEPIFLVQYDSKGFATGIKAPGIKLTMWKKSAYTSTTSPSDNPETDISNPLMFFTDKMGSYPTTILKELSLSDLSIQTGASYYDNDGVLQIVPSWDDTDFAKDLADFDLSTQCDEKLTGSVDLTLDAVCFYNLDLTKRIKATNIIDTPANIISMTYNLSNFMVTVQVESGRYYKRTVSLPYHGE